MKRSFAFAILGLLVLAMAANAANIQATTVALWGFNEQAPGTPAVDNGPVIDSADGHNGYIRVGQNGVDGDGNPIPITPMYVDPSPFGNNPQAALHLNPGYFNEPTDGLGATYKQDHVVINENTADFNLMLGDLQDYILEACIKMPVKPYADLTTFPNDVGGTIMSKRCHNEWAWTGGMGWSWRFVPGDPATNPDAGKMALYIEGTTSPWPQYQNFLYPDAIGNTNLFDNQWHDVAAVIDANANPALTKVTFYVDGVPDGTTYFTNRVYNPSNPWFNENIVNSEHLWIGDQQGRWNDQFVGEIDWLAFSRVPEPSSLVLLAMGALALIAIRRAK